MANLTLIGEAADSVIIDCQNHTGWTLNVNTLIVGNMIFKSCSSAGNGGALSITGSQVLLSSLSFVNNSAAGGGGAVYLSNTGDSVVTNCTFVSNYAYVYGYAGLFSTGGGGLYVQQQANNNNVSTIISGCTFTGNSQSNGNGGGVNVNNYNNNNFYSATVTISNCFFTGNSAFVGGGGMSVNNINDGYGFTAVTISNCTFTANIAQSGAGVDAYTYSGLFHSTISITNCTFTGNYAFQGGGVYADNYNIGDFDSTVSITSCIFTANSASYGGGGVYAENYNSGGAYSTVSITNCTFTANSGFAVVDNLSGGGGVYVINGGTSATVTISNCLFTGNSAPSGSGGGLYVSNNNNAGVSATVSVSNCIFISNFASSGTGGGLYVNNTNAAFGATVSVSNCIFISNFAPAASGGGISVGNEGREATFTLRNCNITANSAVGDGGGIFAVNSLGGVTIINCNIDANDASGNGGGVAAQGSGTLSISSSFVTRNSAALGGAVALLNGIATTISGCTIMYNKATAGGGVYTEGSPVSLTDVYTSGNTAATYGGELIAVLVAQATLQSVSFTGSSASSAGGSIAIFFTTLTMTNSSIMNASAPGGAGLFVDPSSSATISCSLFSGCNASQSGAALEVLGAVSVNNTSFLGNQAGQNGAGLYTDTIITADNPLSAMNCTNCTFAGNHAALGGSCIFWQGIGLEPSCVDCVHDASNTAGYGLWKATPALSLLINAAVPQIYTTSTLQVIATLQDFYHQPVVITPVPVLATGGVVGQVTGNAAMPNGSTVADVTMFGRNKQVQLTFSAWTLVSQPLNISLGSCAVGYGFSADRCQQCIAGTYTYNTDMSCQPCNSPLTCDGGANVTIATNYWPNINISSGAVEAVLCPFDFCDTSASASGGAGAGNVFIASSVCNQASQRNGSSPLCGQCNAGYTEWSHVCVPCNGPHTGAIVVQLLQLAGIVLLQRILSASSSGSTGFVMLVFLYQFADLALYPKPLLQQLLNTFALQLPATSLGCPFPTSGYGQLATQLLIPLVSVAILGLMYLLNVGVAILLKRRWPRSLLTRFFVASGQPDAYIRTLVVLCLNMYETVLEAAFNFLVCVRGAFNELNVVYSYPTVSCTDAPYAQVRAGLIVLIAVFVLAPLAVALWLYRQRHTHAHSLDHLKERYGRLYAEYKPQYYFWECITLLRRAILLAVFVPIAGQNLASAKGALIACVAVFTTLQIAVAPFARLRDNNLENLSLMSLGALIGLFANTDIDPALQSYLGGVLLILTGLVLVSPSVIAAARTVLQLVRKIRDGTLTAAATPLNPSKLEFGLLQDRQQLNTPLVDVESERL
eukprot:TRINITY_DN1413_c0_g1_i1.p1 TRINITY_DN1413_c0_g1~~TRINITY_DN1413_c0_g1_i1.p1  ORF type:complete len:1327 (+),score=361.21 TRINITY_DN1413_c0_g1_i1:362-4342(+)